MLYISLFGRYFGVAAQNKPSILYLFCPILFHFYETLACKPPKLARDKMTTTKEQKVIRNLCAGCGKEENCKWVCERCHGPRYCSVQCQETHWTDGKHMDKCKEIQALASDRAIIKRMFRALGSLPIATLQTLEKLILPQKGKDDVLRRPGESDIACFYYLGKDKNIDETSLAELMHKAVLRYAIGVAQVKRRHGNRRVPKGAKLSKLMISADVVFHIANGIFEKEHDYMPSIGKYAVEMNSGNRIKNRRVYNDLVALGQAKETTPTSQTTDSSRKEPEQTTD